MIFYPALLSLVCGGAAYMTVMPGQSHQGALAPLDAEGRARADALRADVVALVGDGRERSQRVDGTLDRAADHIVDALGSAGYPVQRLGYASDQARVVNVEATLAGQGDAASIVVVGAHYDTAAGAPGADDNASGVAAMLAIARALARERFTPSRTLRFVAFANEEPPFFWNEEMGSLVYAKACKAKGERIAAMLSLETLGYFSDERGSQKYPPVVSWFYPDRGDFIGFVGNTSSRSLVRASVGAFRRHARFPSEGAALPGFVAGVGWSDHWSFWQQGYPAVMVTDTAPFRNPHYHQASDRPETLDYDRLSRVTDGLVAVVKELAGASDGAPAGATADVDAGSAKDRPGAPSDRDGGAADRDADAAGAEVSLTTTPAVRGRVVRLRDEPALLANASLLHKHFGAPFPRPLLTESVRLDAAGRRAWLVVDEAKARASSSGQATPLLLVVDDKGALLWSKESPVAGITAPVAGISLGAGPRGRVAIAACDPPTSTVALRVWDDDGAPFADFVALSGGACSDVTLLYWPRHGWVLAAPRDKGTVAQRVSESGSLVWGAGLEIAGRSASPVSLAVDTRGTFVAVQAARAPGDAGGDRVLAYRYDARGAPLWEAPVDLGAAPSAPQDRRFTLGRPLHGVVRVTLDRTGKSAREVDVASTGEVLPVGARAGRDAGR